MEFQNCAFEGRALLLADDRDFAIDSLKRSRNLLKEWDGEDAVDGIGFLDPPLPDIANKSILGDQCLKINGDGAKDHPSVIARNELMGFGTRFPNKASDEKFDAARQIEDNLFSVDNSVLSFPESSVSGKRAKVTNLQSLVPTCQVFGCNKDLSSSKDYHRRHKVCDVHSKTAVVIVNGIRQRFCQQCSRFHILAEFDEGKRSCRKRLAGHNERRRKPQFNTHLGSTYFTTDASNSLIFSRILPNSFFNLQCNEPRRTSQLEVDVKLSESVLRFHGMGKQYPSKNCLKKSPSSSSLPEIYSSSDSGCALSLLSARKHNHPLVSTGNDNAALFTAQNSAETPGGSSYKNFPPFDYSSNGVTADSEIQSAEANTLKLKSYLAPQGTNTVDLLELSLHLQRVEQQKYYGQIKIENDVFCDSTIA